VLPSVSQQLGWNLQPGRVNQEERVVLCRLPGGNGVRVNTRSGALAVGHVDALPVEPYALVFCETPFDVVHVEEDCKPGAPTGSVPWWGWRQSCAGTGGCRPIGFGHDAALAWAALPPVHLLQPALLQSVGVQEVVGGPPVPARYHDVPPVLEGDVVEGQTVHVPVNVITVVIASDAIDGGGYYRFIGGHADVLPVEEDDLRPVALQAAADGGRVVVKKPDSSNWSPVHNLELALVGFVLHGVNVPDAA